MYDNVMSQNTSPLTSDLHQTRILLTRPSLNEPSDTTRRCSCCQSRHSKTFTSLYTSIGYLFLLTYFATVTLGFTLSSSRIHSISSPPKPLTHHGTYNHIHHDYYYSQHDRLSSTQLNVWWFSGSSSEYTSTTNDGEDDDSCELVAVRIDRTSPNSRRISAEISIPRPIDDVWAILTDYDRLATHVPNLVESRRIMGDTNGNGGGLAGDGISSQPGDGSYKCRLYQKGAQKIIGFEFGASLVMDMTESIRVSGNRFSKLSPMAGSSTASSANGELLFPEDRRIGFKCIESQFFSEFDGEWKVQASMDTVTGDPVTIVTYVVDVRPKGPVPVAALEWRIREDVPTNLRAVKKAAMEVGYDGVMAMRQGRRVSNTSKTRNDSSWTVGETLTNTSISTSNNSLLGSRNSPSSLPLSTGSTGRLASAGIDVAQSMQQLVTNVTSRAVTTATNRTQPKARLLPVRVKWYDDETMAKYLNKDP